MHHAVIVTFIDAKWMCFCEKDCTARIGVNTETTIQLNSFMFVVLLLTQILHLYSGGYKTCKKNWAF